MLSTGLTRLSVSLHKAVGADLVREFLARLKTSCRSSPTIRRSMRSETWPPARGFASSASPNARCHATPSEVALPRKRRRHADAAGDAGRDQDVS